MKQSKRNFVIEYKSGRRRSATTQSSSIWGNLDLKSVAQAVETDMPTAVIGIDAATDSHSRHSAQDIVAEVNGASVAPPAGDDAVARVDPGTIVDNDTLVDSDETIGANDAIGSPEGDATGEAARSESGGSEPTRRRVRKANVRADRQPVKPKSAKTKLVSLSEADKELAGLFQLEEENRQLRRLLVGKLRKDNEWLRDRLRRG